MRTYPKIETLFDRDKDTFRVIEDEFRRLEFSLIDRWCVTEKIDGTNIRLHWMRDVDDDGTVWTRAIGGRTEKAQIPAPLMEALRSIQDGIDSEVQKIMDEHGLTSYTLFGEGYGPGIQKGGGNYRTDPGFILFDVLVNDKSWLGPLDVRDTARRIGIDSVPILDYSATIDEIVEYVKEGFKSIEALSRGGPTDFLAEGVIAVPEVPLYNSRGDRVMWKLKYRDFVGGRM